MILDKTALINRAISWQKSHPPRTGYTERVFREVCGTALPPGANLLTQIAAQYTGREEAVDLVRWDTPERRLPYSQTYRYCLDRSADCSSFWYVMFRIFFSIDIGTWTEAQYKKLSGKQVPWADRRVGDIVLYNFKASSGRHASHAACVMGAGLIGHTTSPSNPFRFEADTYEAGKRVGCYRVLSDAQYQSLFVVAPPVPAPIVIPPQVKRGSHGPNVVLLQTSINKLGYRPVLKVDGDFGWLTYAGVLWAQKKFGIWQIGVCGPKTWAAILAAVSKL